MRISQELLCNELRKLTDLHNDLQKKLGELKRQEKVMDSKVHNLWQLPSWFIITDFTNIDSGSDFCSTSTE